VERSDSGAGRPALSIVTVCRNLADAIEATCRSVVGQEWRGFEWIVVDGASTDGTLDVLARYRKRMAALISEPDQGPYDAMNKGIRAARGTHCLFLNGGDRLADPGVLGRVFGGGPRRADILYGDEYRADEAGNVFAKWIMPPEERLDKLFFVADTLRHQSTFIRRELFERFGPYDLGYRIAADLEKWIVFAENGSSFERLPFPVSVFGMGGLSSSKDWRETHRNERAEVLAAHFSRGEIAEGRRRHKRLRRYHVVRRSGAFTVGETPDGTRRRYAVFGVPLLKDRKIGVGRWQRLLFGVIPVGERSES
jgi:glycosyltransferase involved in cell wall biosynthesis